MPGHTTNSPEEVYKSFESLYWTRLVKNGEVVSGPIRIGTSEGEAVCMKNALSPRNRAKAVASCLMFRATWTAEFVGDEKELDNFFQVISRISH
jgi:hypothetical protein